MILVIQIPNPVANPLKIADINKAIQTAVIDISDLTADQIRNLAITSGKIADGAIITDKVLDGAITTVKILDGAITEAKIHTDYKTVLEAAFAARATTGLDNISAVGKKESVGWGLPDRSRAVALTSGSFPYTAPSDGYFVATMNSGGGTDCFVVFSVGGIAYRLGASYYDSAKEGAAFEIALKKNEVVTKSSAGSQWTFSVYFIPVSAE